MDTYESPEPDSPKARRIENLQSTRRKRSVPVVQCWQCVEC